MQEKVRSQNNKQLPAKMHTNWSSPLGMGAGLSIENTGTYMPLGNFYTRNISVCCVQLKVILRSNLYLFLRLFVGCVSVGRCAIRTKLSRQCHALASSPAEKDAGEGTRVNGRDIL